ncbi:uncharacterized protein LOC118193195 [Stegodyphus dumicola]|uniref:uncharacterized protein LOC118193195 n=1 Tax=Stegodyphus dumicola TaxID=202533 RepID=UPI0015A84520|nr:uncharacterized protein LOC118193195 [Stegodyphus dumicola]
MAYSIAYSKVQHFSVGKMMIFIARCLHSCEKSRFTKSIPSLVIESDKKVSKYTNLLQNFGFSERQISRIFNSPHSVLTLNENELKSNLVNWHSFEVNDKFFTMLTANPELMLLNPEYVNLRKKELMTVFTRKDIAKLFVTCPKVFLDDFPTILEKIQYILHHMGVDQKSIVKSTALQFDLSHIKYRHTFMLRAGRYRLHKRAKKLKNPPLHKIFSRNITTFLKLTGLTEDEYSAFCECYDLENIENDEDETDDLEYESDDQSE